MIIPGETVRDGEQANVTDRSIHVGRFHIALNSTSVKASWIYTGKSGTTYNTLVGRAALSWKLDRHSST